MKIIVGLGNPGKKYQKTRHNVGFMILEKLQEELKIYGISDWQLNKKFNAETSGTTIKGEKIILVKPMTFMNASGQAVQLIAHFYKTTPKDIIVIHDDKDLTLGIIKVQEDRGHAGHNGIKSIINNIKSKDFTRLRIGIASENEKKMTNTAKFVLGRFSIFEKSKLQQTINNSIEEIKKIIT